ncbi:MAG TPA: hypothetical protein VFL97_04295, partial [Nitrococcus sp.]|nr:hypothetical protein [Nitrococcus sp.]
MAPWDKYQKQAPAGPWQTYAPRPTISVGGRQIPLAEYQAMSPEQRQAIQQQIAAKSPDPGFQVDSSA